MSNQMAQNDKVINRYAFNPMNSIYPKCQNKIYPKCQSKSFKKKECNLNTRLFLQNKDLLKMSHQMARNDEYKANLQILQIHLFL